MNSVITIPLSFRHPLFFNNEELCIDREWSFDVFLKDTPFLYDVLHHANVEEYEWPWEQREVYVPPLFERWNKEKEKIGEYFKKRDRNGAFQPMVCSIGYFISALFWINAQPVPALNRLTEDLKPLAYKPINAEERMDFLLNQPNQYHSYIQLAQLYDELVKIYYKVLIITKRTSQ